MSLVTDFLADPDGATMAALQALHTWSQKRLRVPGGVEVDFPRLVAWHGDPGVTYRYSGVSHPAADWTPELASVRDMIEGHLGYRPNGVLLNRYRDGRDSIGRHSDVETDLVPGSPIASVSLGIGRTMVVRHRDRSAAPIRLVLEPGSLLLMYGDCQSALTHEIPKDPGQAGERISMTFRCVRT